MQLQAYSAAWEEIIACDPAIGPALRIVKDAYDACALPCLPGLFRNPSANKTSMQPAPAHPQLWRDDGQDLFSELAEAEVENQELKAMVAKLEEEIQRRLGLDASKSPNRVQLK